jgi:hypothetical protein
MVTVLLKSGTGASRPDWAIEFGTVPSGQELLEMVN